MHLNSTREIFSTMAKSARFLFAEKHAFLALVAERIQAERIEHIPQ
jgi:hypothetical protein